MLAVYDLDCSPVSFDYLWFCLRARLKAVDAPVHVLIVPGKRDGWRTNDHKPITDTEREWRINHILIPITAMAGMTHTVCPARSFAKGWLAREGVVFEPKEWTEENPKQFYAPHDGLKALRQGYRTDWTASGRAKEHAGDWIRENVKGDGPLVTITLRETHTLTRNSTVGAWVEAADMLRRNGVRTMFIRDTAKMNEKFPWDFPVSPLAACDLDIRAALYQTADLNIGRNGGAIYLPAFLDSNYLIFGILAESYEENGVAHVVPTASLMQRFHMPVGSNIHLDNPKKRLIWKPDTDAKLIFDETMKALSPAKPPVVPAQLPPYSSVYVSIPA